MDPAATFNPSSSTSPARFTNSTRRWSLAIGLVLAVGATFLAIVQEPRENPHLPPSRWKWFMSPIQRNAFLRAPIVTSHLWSIYARPDGRSIWAGGGGLILRSTDGGRTWTQSRIVRVAASSSLIHYSGQGIVSNDTGQLTVSDPSFDSVSPTLTPFRSARQEVQALADSTAGDTAAPDTAIATPHPDTAYIGNVLAFSFVNDSVGVAGSESGDLLTTRDAGATWTTRSVGTDPIVTLDFRSATDGTIITSPLPDSYRVQRTRNGGRTWEDVRGTRGSGAGFAGGDWWIATDSGLVTEDPFPLVGVRVSGATDLARTSAGFWSATPRDGGHLYGPNGEVAQIHGIRRIIVPRRGDGSVGRAPLLVLTDSFVVYRTYDGGSKWRRETLPGDLEVTDINALANKTTWAVTAFGGILRSGGQGFFGPVRWEAVTGVGGRLRDVDFADAEHGWALDRVGDLFRTIDGGRTWTPQASATDVALTAITAVSRDTAIAVGPRGTIVAMFDGRRWHPISLGSSVRDTAPPDLEVVVKAGRRLLTGGSDGIRLAADNPEAEWRRVPLPNGVTASITDFSFRDEQAGWACTNVGLFRTGDGGQSWQEDAQALKLGSGCQRVAASATRVFVMSQGSVMVGDTGSRWRTWDSPYFLHDLVIGAGDTAWISGERGALYAIAPTDTVPRAVPSGTTADLTALAAADGRVWAVGDGVVLRHEPGGGWESIATPGPQWPAPWFYAASGVALVLVVVGLRRPPPEAVMDLVEGTLASDRPIQRGDPDPLELGVLAQAVSRFLRNEKTDPPLTLAVTGAWGTGKSSLMNLIRDDLRAWGFRPVWFNAWHHQTEDHLLAAFLENVRAQAIPSLRSFPGLRFRSRLLWKRRRKLLIATLVVVCFLAGLAWVRRPGFGGVGAWLEAQAKALRTDDASASEVLLALTAVLVPGATVLAGLASLLRGMKAFGVSPSALLASLSGSASVRDLKAQTSFRHRFAQEFDEVTEALTPWDLVVFVDDLDRCRAKQVVDLLEGINFLCTSGRCVVMMGMDMDRVERCVAMQLKDEGQEDDGGEEGTVANGKDLPLRRARNYLEKLINIEIPVPAMDEGKAIGLLLPPEPALDTTTPARVARGLRRIRPVLAGAMVIALAATAFEVGRRQTPAPTSLPASAAAGAPVTGGSSPPTSTNPGGPSALPGNPIARGPNPQFYSGRLLPAPKSTQRRWPVLVGMLLTVAVAAGLYLARPDPVERDSPRFAQALAAWSAYTARHRKTPRAIKKYLNRVRYCAMRQRVPDPAREWTVRVWSRLRGEETRGRYLDGAVPDHVLVAVAALAECEPELLNEPGFAARFSRIAHERVAKTSLGGPEDPLRLDYAAPFDPLWLETFRRLSASVRS